MCALFGRPPMEAAWRQHWDSYSILKGRVGHCMTCVNTRSLMGACWKKMKYFGKKNIKNSTGKVHRGGGPLPSVGGMKILQDEVTADIKLKDTQSEAEPERRGVCLQSEC